MNFQKTYDSLQVVPCAIPVSMLKFRTNGKPNRDDIEKWVTPTFLLVVIGTGAMEQGTWLKTNLH